MAEPVGAVVRLQVQRSPLKPGPRGARVYEPAPLLEVPEVEVGPRGLVAPGGVLDVHHADHPDSRNVRLLNGLSVLPRAHYAALRTRFGAHVVDGSAGENLLLDTAGPLAEDDLRGPLLLDTEEDEPLVVEAVMVASPCVEFARWVLGGDPQLPGPVDDELQEAMAALDDGARGFYLRVSGSGRVARGARLRRG